MDEQAQNNNQMPQNGQMPTPPMPPSPNNSNQNQQNNTGNYQGLAAASYLIFFLPLFFEAKNNPFVKFHMRQGFGLFCFYIIRVIVQYIPVISLFGWILSIVAFVFFIMGMINVFSNKEKELPVIGPMVRGINFS